ncbi:Uncharacterized protein DBV15_12446, partial [Temnothorax longispinosus]
CGYIREAVYREKIKFLNGVSLIFLIPMALAGPDLPQVPNPLKSIQKYLTVASKHDQRDNVVTTKKELHDNEAITNDVTVESHLENWALKLFLYADKNDRAANFSKNVLQTFYTAQILYEVLTLFGELSVEAAQNWKYVQWKVAYFNNCFTNGETPVPGPMKEADNESTSINASNDNDDEPESSVNPGSPKDNTLLDLPTTRTQWFESEDDKYGAKLTVE